MDHAPPPVLGSRGDVAAPALDGLFGEPAHPRPVALSHHILVVEDDTVLSRSVVELLADPSRILHCAATVGDAVSRLMEREYDLVLLDYHLPDATGLAVMEWLAGYRRNDAVIVVSGEDSFDAAIGALRRGACDYLRKPYHPDQLKRSVTNILAKVKLERSNDQMRSWLERSEQLHRYLVEQSLDLIFTLGTDGRFTYFNRRIESMLGFRREEVIGQHYAHFVWESERPDTSYVMRERRTGARASSNVELRLRRNAATLAAEDDPYVTVVLNSMGMYSQAQPKQPPRFLGTYGVARDISDRKHAEEMIAFQAWHDQLTQLPNRALFKDRLELAIAQAQRRGATIGVMFIDLDRFKLVNDSFGHAEGDNLLRQISARIKQCLRRGDTLARQGGDEFIALLPDITCPEDAGIIARKVLDELHTPFQIAHTEFRASVSIGISLYPRDGTDAETLTRHADIAMYQIKTRGKNNFCYFSAEMNAAHILRITLERQLQHAIEHGELRLEYQPKYSVSRRRTIGVEALLRWQHAERGTISPSDFIGIAEESGLIQPISDWVLDEACAQLADWQRNGHDRLQLAVNLSPRDFDRDDIVDDIVTIATRHSLQRDTLEIEITENSLLKDAEGVAEKIRELRRHGFGVAIDDFGTGFSSLAYLQHLPVTSLKIDRRFVQALERGNNRHPIVSAIAGVAQGFGLHVIAEGVETEQQVYALRSMGCDEMQGYYFGRPLPADALSEHLQHQRSGLTSLFARV